jgi:hypothetical protein
MNERIRQLAVQSKLGSAEFGNGIQYYVATQETFEKFAELIVRECISSVGSQADKAYLKKHFGLQVESDIIYPATDESWSVESQYKRKYNIAPGAQDNPDLGGI